MNLSHFHRLAVGTLCLLCTSAAAGEEAPVPSSVLADYVSQADESYGWKIRRRGDLGSAKYAELTLTSQTWREIPWKHQLFLIRPAVVRDAAQGLLLIGGGGWRPELELPPVEGSDRLPGEAQLLAALADRIGAPVAVLLHVPQQPLFGDMYEDEIISYTFEQFLRSDDDHWPLLLPMVKSAVRGMDCVQEFARQEWNLEVERFTVTGASKRGWTTWLTGAVDARATALAPMVIDMLNMTPQMQHQLDSFGEYSEQIRDYTERGLQKHLDTPRGRELNAIVDPYAYRQRLTQPKLILLGTNDRYWPLDALHLYWDGLQGEKRILYVPNNGHGLKDYARVAGAIAALHLQAAGRLTLPQLTWDLSEQKTDLELTIASDQPPRLVRVWTASAATRDFRDSLWTSAEVPAVEGGYRYALPRPGEGYAALFGEAVYEADGAEYHLSTNVRIIGAQP